MLLIEKMIGKRRLIMNKLSVYFVSKTYGEIINNPKDHDLSKFRFYSPDVFQKGSAFDLECHDEEVDLLTFSKSDAENYIRSKKTEMRDFGRYMWLKEWALIERVYDFDGVKEDFPDIDSKDDFLNKLTNDPWGDLSNYEISNESGYIHEYSKREFDAIVRTDEGTYTESFECYTDAINWLDEMDEEKEDEGIRSSDISL